MTSSTAVRFFIAVPADPQSNGAIFGLGLSAEAAIADAHKAGGSTAPVITESRDEVPTWTVTVTSGDTQTFDDEIDADAYAAEHDFKALECTERLYRYAEKHTLESWTSNAAGLEDLEVDEDLVAAAVAEVNEGFDGSTAQDTWAPESALSDAHEYVDAYVVQDENVDDDLRDALGVGTQLRMAVDLAVHDLILAEISEREAA